MNDADLILSVITAVTLICGALIVTFLYGKNLLGRLGRQISRSTPATRLVSVFEQQEIRTTVRSIPVPKPGFEHKENAHSASAVRRAIAEKHIAAVAQSLGKTYYSYGLSRRDIRQGRAGCNEIHSFKDLEKIEKVRTDKLSSNSMVVCVDTISHMKEADIAAVLSTGTPIAAYTWEPPAAGFVTDELTMTWNSEKQEFVSMCPDGPADGYSHGIWDMSGEHAAFKLPTVRNPVCYLASMLAVCLVIVCAVLFMSDPKPNFAFRFFYDFCWFEHPYNLLSPKSFVWLPHGWKIMWVYIPQFSFPVFGYIDLIDLAYTSHNLDYVWRCPAYSNFRYVALAIFMSLFVPLTIAMCHTRSTIVASIYKVTLGQSRVIYYIVPATRINVILSMVWGMLGMLKSLKRCIPVVVPVDEQSTYATMGLETVGKGKTFINLSKEGSSVYTSFDHETVSAVKALLGGKNVITPGSLAIIIANKSSRASPTYSNDQLAMLISYLSSGLRAPKVYRYTTTQSTPFNYVIHPNFLKEPKPAKVDAFMGTPVPGYLYSAMSCRENDEAFVKYRITDVSNKTVATAKHISQAHGFITEFMRGTSRVCLAEVSEVREKQCSRGQRDILDLAEAITPLSGLADEKNQHRSFQKAEAYGGLKDPRGISIMPPSAKLTTSVIAYALSKVLKAKKWYAFGRKPAQVSERVAEIMSGATTAGLSDFSRMDGTISPATRDFDRMLLKAILLPDYHERAMEWYDQVYLNRFRTSNGVKYDQEFAQASGDPLTSALNTCRSAFIAYLGYLAMGMTPTRAYESLGIYGGDDGVSPDAKGPLFAKVAKQWGFNLELVHVARGGPVEFLSRRYGPGVWAGDPANVACLARALAGFSVSVKTGSMEAHEIAWLKASSLLANDQYTPALGPWARKILSQTVRPTLKKTRLEHHSNWSAKAAGWTIDRDPMVPTQGSYQASMSGTPQWAMDYANTVFDSKLLDRFTTWAEGKDDYTSPPVLHDFGAPKTKKHPAYVAALDAVVSPEPEPPQAQDQKLPVQPPDNKEEKKAKLLSPVQRAGVRPKFLHWDKGTKPWTDPANLQEFITQKYGAEHCLWWATADHQQRATFRTWEDSFRKKKPRPLKKRSQ